MFGGISRRSEIKELSNNKSYNFLQVTQLINDDIQQFSTATQQAIVSS
jgi:hypothetical protein